MFKSKKEIRFLKDFKEFSKVNDGRFSLDKKDFYRCLDDNTEFTGFDAHYVFHPAWAARIVQKINPKFHIDISSTLHFCTIVSAFIKVKFYDYRPAVLGLSNLDSEKADLNSLPFEDNSVESISCMHTLEHIGLGRYGDKIDARGDLKAINELKRVTAKNGNLLIVVPVGKPKIMYNAHRIYSFEQIENYMEGFSLKNFALINDKNEFIDNCNPTEVQKQTYGCGCFWYQKK